MSNENPTPAFLFERLLATSTSHRDRWQAADQIRRLSRDAIPDLVVALDAPERALQQVAAEALQAIGPPARVATRPLLRLLTSDSWSVRAHAAAALRSLSPRLGRYVPLLIAQLAREDDVRVRWSLIGLIGMAGRAARSAVPILARERDCDQEALAAWAAIDPADSDLHSRLRCGLADRVNARARWNAAGLLGRIALADPELLQALEVATTDRDAHVRHAAREAIARIERRGLRRAVTPG
ncbi:MAG: HEAT repeat domain-containing protein [Hyphomicrobium sp.]